MFRSFLEMFPKFCGLSVSKAPKPTCEDVSREDETKCLTCHSGFTEDNPHWGGGVCRFCWAKSH